MIQILKCFKADVMIIKYIHSGDSDSRRRDDGTDSLNKIYKWY